jgi:hypothetical protein
MEKVWLAVILVCAACVPAAAQSQTPQYENGKILSVKKLPGPASAGGTDAPVASPVEEYDISIQVGDMVYLCRYMSHSDQDLSWIEGKEAQVRIKGNTMYAKRPTGKEAQANIRRRTKAPTP